MSLLAGVASTAVAQELLYVKEPTMGVNVIPAERNRWTAKWIRPASDVKAAVEYPDVEFFRREYGKSCAPFTLDVTPKGASRLWGETYDAHSGQAVRFGRGWVDYPYARVEVRADIVQTGAGETAWTLFLHGRKGKKELTTFKTAAGTNAVARTVRMIRPRHVYADGGLELVAKGGEGIRAEVRNLRVVPVRIPVTYRRAFTLRERPWRAGLSLPGRYWCPVRVNGVDVQHVTFDYGTCTMDIAPLLAAGTNVVEVTVDANSGWERTPRTAVEVFAVYADGTRDLVASDGSWQACGADGVWGGVRTEGTCGIDRMPNGHPYSTGTLPLHAGALAPKPHGTEWPVFDEGQAIRWDVALPPGLKEGKVDVEVVNAFTGEPEQRRTGETPVPPGSPLTIALDGLKGGAYRLKWILLRDGKPVDAFEDEMIVIGRFDTGEFDADEIEDELSRRKVLVDDIDATAEFAADKLLDHSGYFTKHRTNVGRVIERDGFKVRETGPGFNDILSFHVRVGTLGAPHLIEVDYPDTREQYLYGSLTESVPIPFCNNGPPYGSHTFANSSGSAFSGGIFRPSGKMKTFRFVAFPTSRAVTFNLENGMYGKPAGICRIRVYEVKGGLPAMRIPKTDRVYMNHNERQIFFNWGNAECPYMHEYYLARREDSWKGVYRAIENRVQQLRFFGHNAALEGAFMYYFLFKTQSGESESVHRDFDVLVPLIKAYRANGIRPYLSYEYTGTPNLLRTEYRDTSDRDVAAGKPTLSLVDRYGRQAICDHGGGGWMNFLDPRTKRSMSALLGEIYDRYEPLGVEGVVVQTEGCGWQPCFTTSSENQDPDEFGYDDLTFGLFEKETGFRMKEGSGIGGKRFADRYAAVHASPEALAKWRAWRQAKVAEAHRELAKTVKARSPWRYIISPQVTKTYEEAGYTRELYPKDGDVEMLVMRDFDKEWRMNRYADFIAPESRRLYREFDAVYLTCHGLNEHLPSAVDAAKTWWWRTYCDIVYDMKPVGENAFFECTMACRDHTPRTFLHTWLDMNIPTGHDAEERRFLTGFYATPTGEAKPYPEAKGVTAHLYGGKLQLLNSTPYALRERRAWWRFGKGLEIRPFGIVVLDEPRPVEFGIAPESADEVAAVEATFAEDAVRERLGAANCALWDAAETAYDRMVLSRETDFLDTFLKYGAAKAALVNQRRLEEALRTDGVARIDCGCGQPWTDELGVRWLPDQMDTGFRAYGCIDGMWGTLGDKAIRGTERPSIYRTESTVVRKPMAYRIPVPEGTYRVVLHFADNFNKKDAGIKWEFGIGADRRRVNMWEASGGFGSTAVLQTFENVRPVDGAIRVDFKFALINGIEIYR